MSRALSALAQGYDRRSVVALAILFAVYTVVGVRWFHLLDLSRGMDWLLAGIWLLMTALLCWDVRARRDLPLLVVAFVGGLLIEAWGTQTELWTYFTAERPPPWILPAWPVAALAIDRLHRWLLAWVPSFPAGPTYALLVPAFVVAMTRFVWPSVAEPWTQAALVGMVVVTLTPADRRGEVLLFVAGSALGVLLETWGTSRRCWTYYTREVPPVEAVVAHGFASLAFARGTRLALWLSGFAGARRTAPEGRTDRPPAC